MDPKALLDMGYRVVGGGWIKGPTGFLGHSIEVLGPEHEVAHQENEGRLRRTHIEEGTTEHLDASSSSSSSSSSAGRGEGLLEAPGVVA